MKFCVNVLDCGIWGFMYNVHAFTCITTPPRPAVPAITDFPEGPCTEPSVVTLDTSIFQVPFPCTAFGIPAPTVVWTCQAENCVRGEGGGEEGGVTFE